ncbi:hypothetical protein AEGHOMDF_5510 [Methylobacterium soli]|nr:hypothetical protein AEGHOMDF_5510 [Methylobacterium soli]
MQQLDGGGGGVRGGRVVVAAGRRDREAEARADAVASGKDRVADRLGEARRRTGGLGMGHRDVENTLNPPAGFHDDLPACLFRLSVHSVIYY